MPEHLLDDFHVGAARDGETRSRVPQLMRVQAGVPIEVAPALNADRNVETRSGWSWCGASPGRSEPRSMSPSSHSPEDRSRLTIDVDFEWHGIGKLLVPLVVRRQARAEMPANIRKVKERIEAPPIR